MSSYIATTFLTFLHRIFTLSFRSFSPLPNTMEFHPGQDYYFISTASPGDIHRMVGGYCTRNHMKIVFKVMDTDTYQEVYPVMYSPDPSHSDYSRTPGSLPQMERMGTTPRTVVGDSGGNSIQSCISFIVTIITML